MASNVVSIYPNGRGRYALGSPDGATLSPGQSLTILLSGHRVTGTVERGDQGDYLRAKDGTTCGLCASMRVVSSVNLGPSGEKLGAWIQPDRCWIDQQDGEALVGNHFALFRLFAADLPDFLRPATDGIYEYSAYDGPVLREEEKKAQWLRMHWQNALVAPTLATCAPTETIENPIYGFRYWAMATDEGVTRWIDARILEIFASTLRRLTAYRFEVIEQNRFRIFAPDDATPVAIVSERVKREVVR